MLTHFCDPSSVGNACIFGMTIFPARGSHLVWDEIKTYFCPKQK